MKMAAMKLGTPQASGLESSSFFLPSTDVDSYDELIQFSPSSCGGGFLVNGVGRMIGSMQRSMEVDAIYGETPRSKDVANRARNRLGRPTWADRPRPVSARFGLVLLPDASRSIVDFSLLHVIT
jgi:hypothetical protein